MAAVASEPGGDRRLRDLTGWSLAIAAGLLTLGVALPLLRAWTILRQGWYPMGDNAVIGLRSVDLWSDPPLLGQPTTADLVDVGAAGTNHPGPVEYYALAGPMAVLGPRVGLLVGAASLVAASLTAAMYLALRRGGAVLMGLTAVGLVLVARSSGGSTLHDPWNSEIALFAVVVAALGLWSVLAGDLAVAWIAALAVSFAAQVHVGAAVLVAPMGLVGVLVGGAAVVGLVRAGRDVERSSWVGPLAALVLLVVLWAPVLASELGSGPSNLLGLSRAGDTGVGLSWAARWLATALAPIPLFAQATPGAILASPATATVVAGYLVLGVGGTLGLLARLRRREPTHLLWATAVVLAVGGLLVATVVPRSVLGRADLFRWMWSVGLVAWLAVAWAAWTLLPSGLRERGRVAVPALCLLLAVALGAGVLASADVADERDGLRTVEVGELAGGLREVLPVGTYRIGAIDADGFNALSGLVLDLDEHGYGALVDVGPYAASFAPSRRWEGEEVDGALVVSAQPDSPGELVASVSGDSGPLVVHRVDAS